MIGLSIATLGALLAQLGAEECSTALARARFVYESGNYASAVVEFERALSSCADRSPILLALAQAQLLARQIEPCIATLKQLLDADPNHVAARKLLGDALYFAGREIDAEESLKAALAIDPKHEPSLYALGRIYYQQNRFPEAEIQFRKVLEIDPRNYRAHDNLALVYDALFRDADALRHFTKALELVHKDHPDYDWAHANLADFFLRRNNYEKAFQFAAEAAKRNPNSARNFLLTGKALVKLNKEDLSLRWLEQAIKLDPE